MFAKLHPDHSNKFTITFCIVIANTFTTFLPSSLRSVGKILYLCRRSSLGRGLSATPRRKHGCDVGRFEQPLGQCAGHKAGLGSWQGDSVRCYDGRSIDNLREIPTNGRLAGKVVCHGTYKCISSTLEEDNTRRVEPQPHRKVSNRSRIITHCCIHHIHFGGRHMIRGPSSFSVSEQDSILPHG